MNIITATHLGMCFGVRDAIAIALRQSRAGPLTVLGDLVHNEAVLGDLRTRGIRIENDPAKADTAAVMVTAHGASEKSLRALRNTGRRVLEATCPLVHVAHRALKELVEAGFHPVVVGQRGHVEVRGLTEDFAEADIILTEADVAALAERPKFGLVAQTTQPVARLRRLAELVRRRFPRSEIRIVDTVCQPTKQRQTAAEELARAADVVVVIGGANSNNTRELAATCARYCARVHHVQSAADLRPEWFFASDTVGLTAGTSTPDWLIEQVTAAIKDLAIAEASSASLCPAGQPYAAAE